MALFRCCSFNCRGWSSCEHFLNDNIDCFDFLFLQEHWLPDNQLHKINNIHPDFLAVSCSGMDSSMLHVGRPFGGCSIVYKKSLSPYISPISTLSDRFCAVSLRDSLDRLFLLCCVYFPNESQPYSYTDFLNVLGELHGLIASDAWHGVFLVGDFNVDFQRCSPNGASLSDFMLEEGLFAADLAFHHSITFTYQRDDGVSRSWIDHILCSLPCSSLLSDISVDHSSCNLSDHSPLFFFLHLKVQPIPYISPPSFPQCPPNNSTKILWANITSRDIERYQDLLSSQLPAFPLDVLYCTNPDCVSHRSTLDAFAEKFLTSLVSCSSQCLPCSSPTSSKPCLPGWNGGTRVLKKDSCFWNRVWVEAGCPSSGVLFQIKRNAKSRFKYAVRRLKRRKDHTIRNKFAQSFASKSKSQFWQQVKQFNRVKSSRSPTIDGISDDPGICKLFSSHYESILNRDSTHTIVLSSNPSSSAISEVSFTDDEVLSAINQLKSGKKDNLGICSEHLKLCSMVIAVPLSHFFTSVVRHGYIPKILCDSVLIPVPKPKKSPSASTSYRPITLCSNLSKVLEHLILHSYGLYFNSSHLQFGFKSGSSPTHCTGLVKSIVSRFLNRNSQVYGCFLDASKAFDLVNHQILFQKLVARNLPLPIVRLLASWYTSQKCRVRWGSCLSDPFSISNGVRQGSVLSPFLFAVYIDSLLDDLCNCGVGCYWGELFAGCVCYADDIVLLAPCQSALRVMLSICSNFARDHKLVFNTAKTQMICFRKQKRSAFPTYIHLNGELLQLSDKVIHLGHTLSYNLSDTEDVLRAFRDLNRKANHILFTFKAINPFVKSFLIRSFCLSLYGCCLWNLSSPDIHVIEVCLNHILRRIWNLPRNSHTAIGHCLSHIPTIRNSLIMRFRSLLNAALSSSSFLLRTVFSSSITLPNSFIGYNYNYGHNHYRFFTDEEVLTSNIISDIRLIYGCNSQIESIVCHLSCS